MPKRRVRSALTQTQKRKKEHLELCLDTQSISSPSSTGFEDYRFVHNALPELDIEEIDIGTTFLGKRLKAPILISSMTGGFDLARKVNRNLAAAAQSLGLAMGVGSQRVAIEEPSAASSFQVRDVAPDILLLSNLGAVQLNYGYGIEQCRRAVAMISADGLIFHLNVLQEAVQPEGNRNFRGLTEKIARVCRELDVPGYQSKSPGVCTAPASRPSMSPARAALPGPPSRRSVRPRWASGPTRSLPTGVFRRKKR